jgi:tol-pal system protein YbgF
MIISFNGTGRWLPLAVVAVLTFPAAVQGQNLGNQQLLDRMQRLQTELTTLQGYVYRGKTPPRLATGTATGASAKMVARMSLRINQLETEIRRLTGRNEELDHRISQLQTRFDKMSTDLEFRMTTLERAGKPLVGAEATQPGAAPVTSSALVSRPGAEPVAGAKMGARVLGAMRQPPAKPVAVKPVIKETPEQLYARAHTLIIKQRNYPEAERVLRVFIDGNAKHKLTPNAHYWLGRTYFVRNNFEQAAFAFAEGVQRFPRSSKAPATLLNLGMSLARLGKNREACTTYTQLRRNYKKISSPVKRRLVSERKKANCRR